MGYTELSVKRIGKLIKEDPPKHWTHWDEVKREADTELAKAAKNSDKPPIDINDIT
jgi:hypothetical protein